MYADGDFAYVGGHLVYAGGHLAARRAAGHEIPAHVSEIPVHVSEIAACVQPGAWRKPSHSSSDPGVCVEVSLTAERALIRDTKDRDGGTLRLRYAAWSALLAHVKQAR